VEFTHLLHRVSAHRYGIEIDANRAERARALGIESLQPNVMDVRCPPEEVSLLYLNPSYDWEMGESNNQRLEAVFLEHTYVHLEFRAKIAFLISYSRSHVEITESRSERSRATRHPGSGSGNSRAAKAIGHRCACIRRYAHSYYFLDVGGIEVFRCLPRIPAGNKEIDTDIQVAIEERPDQGAAKLFNRSSCALDIQNRRVAAGAQRFGAHVFEFASGLQAEGQFLSCSQQIDDGPRRLWCGLSRIEVSRIRLGKSRQQRS
jgi:hypothetical protein